MDTEIRALDNLCKVLYESIDGTRRLQAEQNLAELTSSPDCLRRCMLLLQSGTAPFAHMVASNTLMKLLSSKIGVSLQQRLELNTYLLHYLDERSAALPPFVLSSLYQLFARITKLGWHDYDLESQTFPFREPVSTIIKLAEKNSDKGPLAVQLLAMLVSDVNSAIGFETVTKQRKTASSFRDGYLFDIFGLATSMLRKIVSSGRIDERELSTVSSLLQLSLNCLSFDFIGSLADETNDDNATVQVPTLWRLAFTDGELIMMFFRLYNELPIELTTRVLQNIVQLSSLRRTLFSNPERQTYLTHIVKGVKGIMEQPDKLRQQVLFIAVLHFNVAESFHEFCRIVSRLKGNYQLIELMKVEEYSTVIALLADFTEQSLRSLTSARKSTAVMTERAAYEFSANSTYYLLSFWQRMVSSVPYVKAADPHLLNLYCPKITATYVESRLQYARAVARGDIGDDPLDDQGAIQQVMEQIAIICRCEYEKSAELIIRLFDHDYTIYERSANNPPSAEARESVACLTWLVTIIGAAIQGRASYSNCEEHDVVDGNLICRVLKLMELSDSRLSAGMPGNYKLEVAYLYMLDQFRKIYVSDQIQKISKVYDQLEKNLGLQDETAYYESEILGAEEKLIDDSLVLLNELSLGFSAGRRLMRLPDIQLLLNNHSCEHFSFLSSEADLTTMRSRTTFYASLMRLLCLDLNDNDTTFYSFMQPLTDAVREIYDVFAMSAPTVDQERVKRAVIGLCRDLRGISTACHTKYIFSMLFDWMYPNVFSILARSVDVWADCTEVISPILKLLVELCQNRQQRLQFEMSSCSAVLLFREVSKIICTYGTRMLALPKVIPENAYKQRYKNIGTIFAILKMALSGSYIPFGVFRLYGDTCLQDALAMFVKLLMYIPEEEFHSYSKIIQNFHSLLESIAQDNMCFLSNIKPEVFTVLMRYIEQATISLDAIVVTASCSTLDLILNYLYRRLTRAAPPRTHVGAEAEGENCIRALEAQPSLLPQEECFQQWKMELLANQPQDKRTVFEEAFTSLMDGVERNVSTRNKDTFTQNMNMFRKTVQEIIKGDVMSAVQPLPVADMMS
ncbi:XPO7 [Dirofilaria immitis]|nr:XPO7 [Dirofilaria immitis]